MFRQALDRTMGTNVQMKNIGTRRSLACSFHFLYLRRPQRTILATASIQTQTRKIVVRLKSVRGVGLLSATRNTDAHRPKQRQS
jgi:hypothetical protein